MSSKRKLIMPTPEEDAAINRGIAADPDTYELGAEEFKQLKKRGGRPRLAGPGHLPPQADRQARRDQDSP